MPGQPQSRAGCDLGVCDSVSGFTTRGVRVELGSSGYYTDKELVVV